MKKLVYLIPAVVALALPACGDDSSGSGTDGDASSGGDGSTSGSASDPTVDPSGSTGNETEADPTIDPDTTAGDSSGGDECDPGSECGVEGAECEPGDVCLACICVPDGDADVCPGGWGDGEYADCVTDGNGVCTSETLTAGCVVDDPGNATAGACYFSGCEEACDCPAPPQEGFEEQIACDDVIGDEANDCFIDCSGGADCPDGMYCFANAICFHGEEPKVVDIPNYGDCVNQEGMCTDGICLVDDTENVTQGICSGNCTDVDGDTDCDAPDTGDSVPDCVALDEMLNVCILPCDENTVCPDGTICGEFGICTFALPPVPGFDNCASQPDQACLDSETCVGTTDMTNGDLEICAATGCVDPASDCPAVPETGDAPAACQNIDGMDGDECVLDCSGGETCPDGAVCSDDGYCSYELPTFTFQEDFESGMLGVGWTVHDVDGNTPSMSTSFVTDGWVVTDAIDGVNFAAVSTSWYTPAGQSDDWIISPAITLAATATLSWNAVALDPDYSDGYQIFVVPTSVTEFTDFIGSGDPTNFLALDNMVVPSVDPVFEIANEESEEQWRSVDLAAVAGEEVHIAFRNNSNDLNLLVIDNIWVTE